LLQVGPIFTGTVGPSFVDRSTEQTSVDSAGRRLAQRRRRVGVPELVRPELAAHRMRPAAHWFLVSSPVVLELERPRGGPPTAPRCITRFRSQRCWPTIIAVRAAGSIFHLPSIFTFRSRFGVFAMASSRFPWPFRRAFAISVVSVLRNRSDKTGRSVTPATNAKRNKPRSGSGDHWIAKVSRNPVELSGGEWGILDNHHKCQLKPL
jgi:hypothetical protein